MSKSTTALSTAQTSAQPGRAEARRRARRQRALQRRRPGLSRLLRWLLAAVLGSAGLAYGQVPAGTLPTGGQVVVGQGQVQQAANLLVIQQSSQRLGMDWQSFNIGSGATVEFRQPGASSIALNRVVGNSGSEIYGRLKANGQVFLTNPHGVLFAPGSKVDVGALVATTLDLAQEDFARGRFEFTGDGDGAVVNQGSVRAEAGGYLALFGSRVDNQGELSVDAGSVVLASGRAATVSISGGGLISAVVAPGAAGSVHNGGRIQADGGVVTLNARSAQGIAASLVNNEGLVRAQTLVERGGEIWITGDQVATSGRLDASAPAGGDGGRILVMGDLRQGTATVAGTLDASAAQGHGGFVETSAASVKLVAGRQVSTAAPAGRTGTWLIDPNDFTVAAAGGDITGAQLGLDLAANNVVISTAQQGTPGGNGDIFVSDAVTWAANTLTLQAERHIAISQPMTGSGTAALTLEYGQGAVALGNTATYSVSAPVSLPAGNNFRTKLGSDGATTTYEVLTSLAGLQGLDSANRLAGNYALGADIIADATADGGLGFNPIGNETTYTGVAGQYFSGQFEGLGHTLIGLGIARPASNVTGLFASTRGASIRNLVLDGGSVAGSQYVGALAGYADTTTVIANVASSVQVSAVDNSSSGVYAGGLVGRFEGAAAAGTSGITGSSSSGTVQASTNTATAYAGGVAGYVTRGTLAGLTASGAVSTTASGSTSAHYAGGVVGLSLSAAGITDSLATGTVTSGGVAGGLVGALDGGGAVSGSRASGNVSGGAAAGGLVGRSTASITGVDGVFTASGDVTGTGNVGGLVGESSGSAAYATVSASGDVTGAAGSGRVGGLVGNNASGGIDGALATGAVSGGQYTGGLVGYFTNGGNIADARAEGSVSGALDVGGLVGYATGAGTLGTSSATGTVTASLGTGSVGGLVGYFNLAGGLSGSEASGNVSGGANTGGLVGYHVTSAALASSHGRGASVNGGTYVGGLVGYSNATAISASTATAAVTGTSVAGGLVGRSAGSVTGVAGVTTASGAVTGTTDVGGLVGRAEGTGSFSDVRATGDVTGAATSGRVGGLIGYDGAGGIARASAAGTVQGGQYAGGLVGYFANTGDISETSAAGSVTAGQYAGGLVGYATGAGKLVDGTASGVVTSTVLGGDVGGLVGYFALAGGLDDGSASGNVSGGTATGGLVGEYASVGALTNSVSLADTVNGGATYAGGLVGYSAAASVSGSRATADVVGGTYAGGLIGRSGGSVTGVAGVDTATGNVSGGTYVGGLVGSAETGGAYTDVRAVGSVTGTPGSGRVGGLIGSHASGDILRATATGGVSGGQYTGGLVGYLTGNASLDTVRAEGNVASSFDVGGLIGYGSGSGAITDAVALGSVTSSTTNASIGGLAGYLNLAGGITRGDASGNVAGGAYAGGLVGYLASGGISAGIARAATVSGDNTVGGLVGYAPSTGTITASSAAAAVTSGGTAGGLVGQTSGSITSSFATGAVSAPNVAGGLVGQTNGSGVLTDVQADGDVQATTAGGLVGNHNSSGAITRGTASGRVLSGNTGGGLVGIHGGGPVVDSHATGTVTLVSDSTVYGGGLIGQYGANCYYCNSPTYLIEDSTASGAVFADAGNSYVGGLVGLLYSGSIADSSSSAAVTARDSVSGNSSGHYAGGLVGYFGYYNVNGTIRGSNASGVVHGGNATGGLVGQYQGAAITDSSASGAVTGRGYVGGLIGLADLYAAASNLSATGNVAVEAGASGNSVGGLIGYVSLQGGGLSGGFASGSVTAPLASQTGGLIGQVSAPYDVSSVLNDSAATGDVVGGNYTGGLVGYYYNYYGQSPLLNSHATGNVTGGNYTGGLLGGYYRYTTTGAADDVTNSYATGDVSGLTQVGGLVGQFQGRQGIVGAYATGHVVSRGSNSAISVGGLAGNYYAYHTDASDIAPLSTSYATGDVGLAPGATPGANTNVYAGGLVGYLEGSLAAVGVQDSYATGNVRLESATGRLFASGLVGYSSNQNIQRTYASGAVSAVGGNTRTSGGLLAARSTGNVVDSYWDTTTTGQAASVGGGTGVDSAALLDADTYANWSIGTTGSAGQTWRIYEGHTRALLTRFLTPLALNLADASKVYDGNTSFGNAALNSASGPVSFPDRIYTAAPSADVGQYAVAADGVYSVQNGYDLSVTGSATLAITPRALTLAGMVADKVYDGNRGATLLAAGQPAGLVDGEDLTVNLAGATAVFDTKDAGTGKVVTVTGLTLADGTRGKASNYTLADATTTTASIERKALDVGGFTATSRVYDGSTTVAVSANAAAPVVGVVAGDVVTVDLASVSSGTIASKHVGTAKPVTVLGAALAGADAANYELAGIDAVTVDITPRTLAVNGLTASNRQYDHSLNVSVSTLNATLGGAVAGDAVQLQRTSVTGQLDTKDVARDGSNAVTTKPVTVAGNLLRLRGADAANYVAQASSTTVTITPRTVYFQADRTGQTDRVYDGTTDAVMNVYVYNQYGEDDLTLTHNAPAYVDKNVAYTAGGVPTRKNIVTDGAVLGGADAGNYVLNNTSYTNTGTISPKPLTVQGVVAVDRAYDGTTIVEVNLANATVDTAGVVQGDQVTPPAASGTGTVQGTVLNKNAGNAKAVTVADFALGGADAGNYTLAGSGGITVNITRKDLTVAYEAVDKVYNGNAYAAISATSGDIVAGDTVRFYADQAYCTTCGYGYFVTDGSTPAQYTLSKDAGENKKVIVTTNGMYGADANNYNLLNPTATIDASITPRGITPVFTGVNKAYDGTTTATVNVDVNASGILGGDAVALARTATFDTKDAGTGKTVTITGIAFSGANAGNYTLATDTASTTASITPKALSVQGVTATDRAYDGTNVVALVAGTVGAGGVVGTDVVTVVVPEGGLGNGTMATKHVGADKAVTVSGLTLAGADAGNYSLDGSQGVTVDITPRPLTATYVGVDRVYNGGVSAQVTASSPDLVAGDALTFTQNAIFTGLDARNVGNNKPVGITGIVMGGADAANYALQNTTASTTASITPKGITVSYVGLGRVYNGLADLSASVLGSSAGLVAGDAVSFTQTARFTTDGAAGTGKPVAVTDIAIGGAQGANYSLLSPTASTTADITPRPIGVTGVTATDRVYDGTRTVAVNTAQATTDLSGVIAGDEVSVVLPLGGITSGTVATKDAGTNKDVAITGLTLTGASAANYVATGANGLTVDITPRPLEAVYAVASRAYDGTARADVSATSADVLAGDVGLVGITAEGSFAAGKNAGTGKTVNVTGGFLTGAERNNYTLLNPTGSTTADITPKLLTPLYDGGTRVYDGTATAPVTARSNGIIAGDTVGYTQTAVFSGAGAKNVGNGKAVQVSDIALTGADAANYALQSTTAATTASVTPKPIDIDGLTGATATDRVYDGTRTVAVTVTTSGTVTPSSDDIVAGDDVQINLPAGGLTSGTMLTKDVGNAKPLTVDGLTLEGADAGNYRVAVATGVTVNITPRPLTAVYEGIDKVYDGTATATVTGSSADVLAGDNVGVAGGGLFTGAGARNAGTGKAVDVLTGRLTGGDAANYTLVNPLGSTTADITPRPVTATYTGGTKVYDGNTTAPVNPTTDDLIVGDAVALTQTAIFTGGKNVGADKAIAVSAITLTGGDAGNYALTGTTAEATGSITPRPLRIEGLTGVTATNRAYDGSTVVAVVVTSSGPIQPNAADLVAGDVVTVTAPPSGNTTGTMADKHVGNDKPVNVVGLSLGGADAANYSVAATSGVTVDIAPRPVTATYTAGTRVYDGGTAAAITGSSADLIAADAVTITGTGVFTGPGARNVGADKPVDITSVNFAGADAANYSLVNPTGTTTGGITPRTVTVSYLGGSRVYDGTTAAPVTGNAVGLIDGDAVGLSQTAVFSGADKNVGVAKPVDVTGITLTGGDAANYALATGTASTTATVTPRPLRIEGFTGVVATDRAYDGTTTVAVTVQGSGTIEANAADIVPGDVVSVLPPASGANAGTIADKNAGLAKPVTVAGLSLTGADAGNYRVAEAAGVTVNITPKPITALYTAQDKVYDGTTAATVSGTSADIVAGDLLTISGSGSFATRNVGDGLAVTIAGGTLGSADAVNYSLLNPTGSANASITPRPLTATYTGGTRVYDGTTDAPVTLQALGLVAGDAVQFGQTAVFTGAGARDAGVNKPVQVSAITVQGADAANYRLVSDTAGTTATVTPRPLNVSGVTGLQAVDRVYDGTRDVEITGSGNVGGAGGDVIAGDEVIVNLPGGALNTGTMADKSAGQGKAVVLAGLTLSGAQAANYTITGTAGLTVNIAPRPVVLLGVSAVDRVYDGTTAVAIDSGAGSISGAIAGDDLTLPASGVTGSMADKHAGDAKAVTVSGLALGGADAANYIASGGTELRVNIAPRLLVPGVTVADKVYDGDTGASITLRDDRIDGDALQLAAASARFADKNAGNAKAVEVGGLTLGGADAANYRLAAASLSAVASITPAPATVTAQDRSKIYGEALVFTGSEFLATGLVAGETIGQVSLASDGAGAAANVAGSPYGIRIADAAGGSFSATNYALTYRDGQLLVNPRPLTVAGVSEVRYADDTSPLKLQYSVSAGGLLGTDSLSQVTVTAPPGAATAAGGSVYELMPSAAVFGSGDPANYALRYVGGLLVVLPAPPRLGDNAPSDGGGTDFGVVFDPAEVQAALDELARATAGINARSPLRFAAPPRPAVEPVPGTDGGALLGGDGRRITLPLLQRLPLITLDPQLRSLITGQAAGAQPQSAP